MTCQYVGRFAPSPSGPLHIGSLLTALTSYLDAHAHYGKWLVRIEDIDPPREQPGATTQILNTLAAHGLHADGEIRYQSNRIAEFQTMINQLLDTSHAYRCDCTRAMIKQNGGLYTGRCKTRSQVHSPCAIRFINPGTIGQFNDHFQGLVTLKQSYPLAHEDMIIQRKDGLIAYNLAVVADDIDQGVTHIIRGMDLLPTTLSQMNLWQHFSDTLPIYGHTPVLVTAPGQKLSKQNHARAVDPTQAIANLRYCFTVLGLDVPISNDDTTIADMLHHATVQWRQGITFKTHEIIVTETI